MADMFYDWNTKDWQPHPRFAGAWVKTLVTADMNPGMSSTLLRLTPGSSLPLHTHDPSIETFFCLKGEATCIAGEQQTIFQHGSYACVPAGIQHRLINNGTEDLIILATFCPPLK